MDKDVLTLEVLFRQIGNALSGPTAVIPPSRSSAVARAGAVRASGLMLRWLTTAMTLVTGLFVACSGAGAEIYRLPVVDSGSEHLFSERAELMRIPGSVATGNPQTDPALNPLLPNVPDSPFQPPANETRDGQSPFFDVPLLAQLPDSPSWAVPTDASPVVQASQGRRIRVRARGGGELNLRMFPRGNERVWIVNTPMQITILDEAGPVEISADRYVVWTDQNVLNIGNLEASRTPIEIYMEGNIEFRTAGTRGIAERMYYNVARQSGVILEGELFGEVSQRRENDIEDFRTPFRLKGQVLQQVSPTLFQATNAAFTTSRLGIPRYWIESDTLSLDTGRTSLIDEFSGGNFADFDPTQIDQLQVTSESSQIFVGGVPIFRWPTFTANLARNPSLYLDRIGIGSDSVFGQQLLTRWNNFQLLGITPAQDTRWTTTLDYLSDRGLGFGSDFEYKSDSFFGRPALSSGFLHSWFINDEGLDNLGEDRRAVEPEESFRGRAYGRHRHITPFGMELTAELGWISDRNFLEQYYEQEWDQDKDQETRLDLKQYTGSGSWSVSGNLRLNDFFTQTEWWPRVDHYELGRALWGNRLTWYEHSHIGYGRLRTAEAPTNSVDMMKWDPLAWEREVEGIRAASRQEIDMPLQLGAMKLVPYLLGEAAHWQQDLDQNEVTRLLGQAGVRASLPWWRVDPTVRNELFNLNGLAHKLVLESDFFYADATEDYENLPLYDALDDDAVEFFRRRLLFDTFGLGFGDDVALRHDERNFALRSGMQRYVAAPSTEIADDLMMLQLRLRQRIQTKRGLPGRERIVDWFTFDIESTWFPRSDRDNFGQEVGPTTYDMKWHVGDRTTILSDGYFDFFGEGLRTASLGLALSRPGRSQYYIGLRSIEGPLSSNVLTSSLTYRMSPKWIWNYGSSIDLSGTGNIGQRAQLVRIGESLLVAFGAYYDASRDNLGLRFDITPRFIRSKLGMIGGRPIPPVGAYGLE